MKQLQREDFDHILAQLEMKPRLKSELRFVASVAHIKSSDWQAIELLSITSRSGNNGVLLLAPSNDIFAVPYELSRGLANHQTGRARPIICDFCRTWQTGNNACSISLKKDKRSINSVGFLCCADLKCSQHVRGTTNAAHVARSQLRENLTNEQRVERLKTRLLEIIDDLQLQPLSIHN